jgi:hypothetical protein
LIGRAPAPRLKLIPRGAPGEGLRVRCLARPAETL